MEKAIIERIKHIETFYENAPPGMVKEYEEQPEECIPDTEGNRKARDFLANAPKKGLWMPLGQEVKVMQCWKCKNYGHRTGDKECPLFNSGNSAIEKFREMHEDPMFDILNNKNKIEQNNKVRWLKQVLEESSTDSSDSDSSGRKRKKKKKKKELWVEKSSDHKKAKKKDKKEHKKHKKEGKHKITSDRDSHSKKRQKRDDETPNNSKSERSDKHRKTEKSYKSENKSKHAKEKKSHRQ